MLRGICAVLLKSADSSRMEHGEENSAVAERTRTAGRATESASPRSITPGYPVVNSESGQGRLLVTREHKLTLIIAFAILLVVGVLVGDHFSKARHASPGVEVATNPTDALNVPTEPSNAPAATAAAAVQPGPSSGNGGMALTNGGGNGAGNVAALPPVPAVTGEEVLAANQPQANQPGANTNPGAAGNVPSRTTTTISMVPVETAGGNGAGGGAGANVQPQTGNGAGARTGEQSPFVFIPEGVRNAPPAAGISTVPLPSGGGAGGNEGVGTGRTSGGLPVSTGKLLAHPVEKGETLAGLARRFYNDATLAKKLAEFNKGKVGEKMALRQGVTLRIPPKDVLLGQAVLPENASPELSSKRPETGVSPKPAGTAGTAGGNTGAENAGAEREYVVQKGDTLGQIASKLLGSSKRAREIVQLNRGVISDQDNLKVGAKLKIPAR